MRRSLHLMIVASITLLLCGCGFQLRNDQQIAPPLRALYLQTPNPDSPFSNQLSDTLKGVGVNLVSRPTAAPQFIINNLNFIHPNLNITTSSFATIYYFSLTANYQLNNRCGVPVAPAKTLVINHQLILNANQVYNGNIEPLMKRRMEQEMVNYFYNEIVTLSHNVKLMSRANVYRCAHWTA